MRSGLKENFPLKPQWKFSFAKGQHLPSGSFPRGFSLQFSHIQPDFTNDFASWIFCLLAALIFTESIVPSSMGEPMELGDQGFSRCPTLLSPGCPQLLSQHSQRGCAITASQELCLYHTGTDFFHPTGMSWASHLLRD